MLFPFEIKKPVKKEPIAYTVPALLQQQFFVSLRIDPNKRDEN